MNIMKFRPLFFVISLILIFISAFSIIKWGFKYSEDFVGGATFEVILPNTSGEDSVRQIFAQNQIEIRSLSVNDHLYIIKTLDLTQEQKVAIETGLTKIDSGSEIQQFTSVGPSLGRELIKKTIVAVILASISLLLFIGSRFKDITFGASAVVAMFHDTFILIGAFSLLGHFFGAELDSLFVTALLTTLSSSVHDTVVTFDRIRELKRQNFKIEWVNLANQAVSEVIVRSINNSMTIIFMLLALVILGGATTRWFAMALLIGVVCGTYSSTGVAIPLVLFWKNLKSKKTK